MGGLDVLGVGSFADFPTLFSMGVYGGLVCCAVSAVVLALYALLRRQGTPRQLAASLVIYVVATCLLFVPAWWAQDRLGVLGPTLSVPEVALALASVGALGWLAPLATLASYVALAAPFPAQSAGRRHAPLDAAALQAALTDPARLREPLGAGQAWGWLTPLDDFAGAPAIPLINELILLGREGDNDIVLEDTGVSRHHAELHWDHGHPQLKDRGSANGTLLNRQAARGRLPLKTGDILQLGARRYRFEALEPEEAARLATEARQSTLADIETRKVKRATGAARPQADGAPAGDSAELSAPLPSAPTLELVAVGGPTPGARWALQAPVMTIGRDQECAITLPDASVSRLHAQIVRQPAGFFIADLRSSNGAYLNGVRLTAPGLIQPGDTLRIGEIELRCEAPTLPAAPHGAAPNGAQWADGADGARRAGSRNGANGSHGQPPADEGEPTTPTEAVPTQPTVAMGVQPTQSRKERGAWGH